MKDILDFFRQLRDNNNKEWFDANRNEYKAVKKKIETLTAQLIANISQWDSSISGLQPADCLYRINRDIRFSKDKSPYKAYLGIFIAKGGKKSGYAGYYFHFEPYSAGNKENGFPMDFNRSADNGNYLLASGTYMLESKYVKVIREDIYNDWQAFSKVLEQASAFSLDRYNTLKKLPAGFESGIADEYLKLKDFCLVKQVKEKEILNAGKKSAVKNDVIENGMLANFICEQAKATKPFLNFINRAIDYVCEQEKEDLQTW
ncbi:MAG: DUF2461 domain-containing protein [Bacteroidales bacterium]|jgi:uncharacterized protein (DUF2461 family)|nr:DUF2461 domain-containing protein [Bacteroidales bacterium]